MRIAAARDERPRDDALQPSKMEKGAKKAAAAMAKSLMLEHTSDGIQQIDFASLSTILEQHLARVPMQLRKKKWEKYVSKGYRKREGLIQLGGWRSPQPS